MALSPKTKKISAGDIATWTRERSTEEIHNLLGRRMSALTLEFADVEDDEEVGLYDLATV
jgi:hypothetical protein